VDIDCKIAAVLCRVEYTVATLLTTAVGDSGGSVANTFWFVDTAELLQCYPGLSTK
jgi:hypothetical protein